MWKNCARCGIECKPAYPWADDVPKEQITEEQALSPADGLRITVEGGYGMFDDPDYHEPLILCHDCSHVFLNNNSWLTKAGIDPRCINHTRTFFGRIQ